MPKFLQRLPAGPLDIVGDVHGEIDALVALLWRLGCDPERRSARRPLVFVGDLVDRGPDSLAVIELVRGLVEAGVAQVVLGNHELNLLLGERKPGNGWFFGDASDGSWIQDGKTSRWFPYAAKFAGESERQAVLRFLDPLPLALERDDLRVVHACWENSAWAGLAAELGESAEPWKPWKPWEPVEPGEPVEPSVAALTRRYDAAIEEVLRRSGLRGAAERERREFADLKQPALPPDRFLLGVARLDLIEQLGNPVKVVTSGPEEAIPSRRPFFVGDKWRFVQRERWWRRYRDAQPVVIGHYWRRRPNAALLSGEDVFQGVGPWAWLGRRRRVFCVDYSVGRRAAERALGRRRFANALAALRWPERTLVFDDRRTRIHTR